MTLPSALATALSLLTALYHGLRLLGGWLAAQGPPDVAFILALDALVMSLLTGIAAGLALAWYRSSRREGRLERRLEDERRLAAEARRTVLEHGEARERTAQERRLADLRHMARERALVQDLLRRKDDLLGMLDRETQLLARRSPGAAPDGDPAAQQMLNHLPKAFMELWVAHENAKAALIGHASMAEESHTVLYLNMDADLTDPDRQAGERIAEMRLVPILRDGASFRTLKAGPTITVSQSSASRAVYGVPPTPLFLTTGVAAERHLVCPDLERLTARGQRIDVLAAHEIGDPAARGERHVFGHVVCHLRLAAPEAPVDRDMLEQTLRFCTQNDFAIMRHAIACVALLVREAGGDGLRPTSGTRAGGRPRLLRVPPTHGAAAILHVTGHLKRLGLAPAAQTKGNRAGSAA